MKKIIFITLLFFVNNSINIIAQLQNYFDDFDQYIAGLPLACQNPNDWTTWSNTPCDPTEDPYISTNHALGGQNSVLITQNNDLIKPLGNITTGRNYIRFYFYIPTGHSGYFALLSKFTPEPNEWAVDCYFDIGGLGRFIIGSNETINFNYEINQWQFVEFEINLNSDWAKFSLNNLLIHDWQWSHNGTITKKLAVHNFFGSENPTNEMYVDNYYLDGDCLNCYPPSAPSNLFVKQIFNPLIQVQLNWQDNSGNEDGFKILRKNGLLNSANSYSTIDTVFSNTVQYLDSTVIVDSTYTYGIVAFNIYGNSDTSNFATITIDPVTSLDPKALSLTFSLSQNYPNPFNPSTTIKFTIPSVETHDCMSVQLKIYDVLGNEVATLVNEEKPAGEYEIEFDGTNLPSGIYFYQPNTGDFIKTQKMVLMK